MRTVFDGRGRLLGPAALALVAALAGASLLLGPADAAAPVPEAAPADPAPAVSTAPARDSYADLVERVAPAVVTIRTEQIVKTQMPDDPFHRFVPRDEGPRSPRRQGGLGSGVVVSPDGYILTNHHVVEDAQRITVELSDRRAFDATLVGSDPPSDLAVLKIDGEDLATLAFGDSDRVRVGDVVLAFGNPLGVGQTVTSGIISAKGRFTGISDASYEDFLQTDAPINRGNSGGPLVSTRAELVGINTQILSQTGGNIGIGFAIPADMAADVMRQLIEHGEVRRGRLGVTVQPVTSEVAAALGLGEVRGALVNQVDPAGPAAEAGIEQGDVITAVNGETVRDGNDLRNRVSRLAPGTQARVALVRDGEPRELTATLARMEAGAPEEEAAPHGEERGAYGMTVIPLTPESARRLGTEATRGIFVTEVDPVGPAASAGIRRGDVIVSVDRQAVEDVDGLKSALDAAGDRPALVLVSRDGNTLFLTLSRR